MFARLTLRRLARPDHEVNTVPRMKVCGAGAEGPQGLEAILSEIAGVGATPLKSPACMRWVSKRNSDHHMSVFQSVATSIPVPSTGDRF